MKRGKSFKKFSETTRTKTEDFIGLEFFPPGSRNYKGELINMHGMNTAPSKSDPMSGLITQLNVREKELDAYIRSITEEKNRLIEMQKEMSEQQERAERDLIRVQRAKAVLRDDDEPLKNTETLQGGIGGIRFTGRDSAYGSDIRIGENEG